MGRKICIILCIYVAEIIVLFQGTTLESWYYDGVGAYGGYIRSDNTYDIHPNRELHFTGDIVKVDVSNDGKNVSIQAVKSCHIVGVTLNNPYQAKIFYDSDYSAGSYVINVSGLSHNVSMLFYAK